MTILKINFDHLFAFLCLLFPVALLGQNSKDNWKDTPATPENFARIMRMTAPTEAQSDTLWNVTQQYCAIDSDTCLLLTTHAVKITKNLKKKSLYAEAQYLHGRALIEHKNDVATGLDLLNSANKILVNEKQGETRIIVETFLGNYYARNKQFEQSIEHLLIALELAKETKDTSRLVPPFIAIGGVYFKMDNWDKAQAYISEAIKILDITKEEQPLVFALANQAMIFQKIGNQYKASADTAHTNAAFYRDSTEAYFRKGLTAANRGLGLAKKMKFTTHILALQSTLASLNNSMGDYKAAERIGKETMLMAEKMGDPFILAKCHLNLSTSQRNLGLYADALRHAQAGCAIVEKDGKAGNLATFEEELFEIYKATGRLDLALPLLEKAMKTQKNNQSNDNKKAVADAETKYRTAEKELENLALTSAKAKVEQQRNYITMGGLLLSFLGFFGYRFQKVKKDRNDKKEFAEALIFAQDEERKRIARDLHDGVGQSLLLIIKQLGDTTQVSRDNQKMIAETLDEVRAISRDLHPIFLENFGLTATINDLIVKVGQSTDLFVTKEIIDIDKCLPPKSEIHLFRAIQEALSNIIKHANATAAKVTIINRANDIIVTILDNGKGFDLELAVVTSKSLGIKTMHERISAIGGHLKISRGEKNGMQVEMVVPK
jgi:signal transduction histidine kinase